MQVFRREPENSGIKKAEASRRKEYLRHGRAGTLSRDEARQALDDAIAADRGGIWLELTAVQYKALRRSLVGQEPIHVEFAVN